MVLNETHENFSCDTDFYGKKIFFSSFLAYLISKHYIANSIVLIKITLDKAN